MEEVTIFTKEGYLALLDRIRRTREYIGKIMQQKSEASSDTDSWHSETFKLGIVEEITWRTQLEKLLDISKHAKVVDALALNRQNRTVKMGNGILLQTMDGKERKIVLGGYWITEPAPKGNVSVQSPLGKAILGAKRDEWRGFSVNGEVHRVKIIDIILPSMVEDFLS